MTQKGSSSQWKGNVLYSFSGNIFLGNLVIEGDLLNLTSEWKINLRETLKIFFLLAKHVCIYRSATVQVGWYILWQKVGWLVVRNQ